MNAMIPEDIIEWSDLEPPPEGRWFQFTFQVADKMVMHGMSAAIYHLLKAEEFTRRHRTMGADEIWSWHVGARLLLSPVENSEGIGEIILGSYLVGRGRLQVVLTTGHAQAERPLGVWSLLDCVVVYAVRFGDFEIVPDGWELDYG